KVSKVLDQNQAQWAIAKHGIEALEEELVAVKRTKRRKIQEDPNLKFATIHTIRRAQIEAGRVEVEDSALEINSKESTTESCIEI
ncbi:unnamed protein product, partial [Tuber aestivum]